MYDRAWWKAQSHPVPIIGVGNVSLGGSGKTPMVEYLLEFLGADEKLAVLSRGYGRTSYGFYKVETDTDPEKSGDELLQIKTHFPKVQVAACEDRNQGLQRLLEKHPDLRCVLLDDNFQHRSIQVDYQILMTTYAKPYFEDKLFPKGTLRDLPYRVLEADHLIVTKCPVNIGEEEFSQIEGKIDAAAKFSLSFSTIRYGQIYSLQDKSKQDLSHIKQVLLLTAIADHSELSAHLEKQVDLLEVASFRDHHFFTEAELTESVSSFLEKNPDGIIISTEKDATRLLAHKSFIAEQNFPIYILPMKMVFLQGESDIVRAVQNVLDNHPRQKKG